MPEWMQERQHDQYFQKAKREGYRSRAVYKLKQINDRYHLIHRGDIVVDLGCAPGGWSQVAAEIVAPSGTVIGIDLQAVDPIPGVTVLQGDMLDPKTVAALAETLSGRQPNVVLSDMSPQITGNRLRDHIQSMVLADAAFDFACRHLSPDGNLVIKVFEGGDLPEFLNRVRSAFRFCKPHAPPASRKESSEIYVIGQGFHACQLSTDEQQKKGLT
jgi:23S rRNA (uridine2552-2'-O)-methyltransferase